MSVRSGSPATGSAHETALCWCDVPRPSGRWYRGAKLAEACRGCDRIIATEAPPKLTRKYHGRDGWGRPVVRPFVRRSAAWLSRRAR